MTVDEAIMRADELRPNAVSVETKRLWLAQLDATLRRTVVELHEADADTLHGADLADSGDTVLLAEDACSGIYVYWLMAQLDLAMGELARYANSMALYNAAAAEFAALYKRGHRPLARGQFRY